ncbi:hypothetical protein HHK36_029698 [Tetracentron sinense]|uniref:Glycosyltransferase family 92 protein n=1 Tax=Tetracentron sinense TaxID=13715 RepID=A0A834YC53_TETSI|nr:hypothetical protein HHK36_029698 [Tetracentron sinense]
MESELQRRKRKRFLRPPSLRPLFFSCFFFFFFLFFLSFLFWISSATFRPILILSSLSSFPSSSLTNSIQDSSANNGLVSLKVEDQVLFPDHVLLLVSNSELSLLYLHSNGGLDCVYHEFLYNSDKGVEKRSRVVLRPVLSLDGFDESRSIARCALPPMNYSAVVNLQKRGRKLKDDGVSLVDWSVHSWDMVVYGAALNGDKVVVFVKGLNLRPNKVLDSTQFSCYFGLGNLEGGTRYALTTKAVSAAQEVVQCLLPISIQKYPERAHGIRVTIGLTRTNSLHDLPVPSVAKIFHSNFIEEKKNKERYELCVCTMVWNQAAFLREWIIYHAWLGVQRWFIYDNNSDDGIKEVIAELERGDYNVSRHVWPWIKTQEAGFSHCALKARDECKWVGFMDVDEFFYFPFPFPRRVIGELGYRGQNSLRSLVTNISSRTTIGEIRMACHSFGPSRLNSPPSQGVTVGYTCRLQSPERHKSIVRPDALDDTLLNVVHHFRLRKGYRYLNMPRRIAVINHYKYQVWEAFRAKFFRRVAAYVADWQENQNERSKDRAPGLGTEAIEPPNWPLQFCEVRDTGLKDLVMANLADPVSGFLPWEISLL